jgi:hypothetical protein
MRLAYRVESGFKAKAELARDLDKTHPGTTPSPREGMPETLTVLRLGVPPTLPRTLRATNTIESMIEIGREHSKVVKRRRDGTMAFALVRHRNSHSQVVVPPCQRPSAPAQAVRRVRHVLYCECQHRMLG